MKKTILSAVTVILLLISTLLTAFAAGEAQAQTDAGETTGLTNEFGKVVEIPTPVVFAISGGITIIAAIVIFRKRKIK